MNINYTIASYAGKIANRTEYFAGKELQIHLQALTKIFEMKRILGRKNYITNVTIVIPYTDNPYPGYYNQEYWLAYFEKNFPATANSVGIKLNYINKIHDNSCFSYDQWIQASQTIQADYHIFIEDDSLPDNVFFDEELLSIYKQKFPDNLGYLSQSCKVLESRYPRHSSIPNGMMSSDTTKKMGPDWRENMVKITMYDYSAQLQFNVSLFEKNIPIEDTLEIYNTPFWRSYDRQLIFHSQKSKNLFIPIQYYLQYY